MSISQNLNNFFESSSYKMINVGKKNITHRRAVASGKLFATRDILERIKQKKLAKGDVIPLAEISGINGAKSTATLLPLCHPLPIEHTNLKLEVDYDEGCVHAYCYVSAHAKTGVEMEAIAGVQAALLCVYDLCKMYGHDMTITDIRLLYKEGGKSHKICHQAYLPKLLEFLAEEDPHTLEGLTVAVISISDRASEGVYEDISGKLLGDTLKENHAKLLSYKLVPDNERAIVDTIKDIVNEVKPNIIFTTGGTGIGPKDITHEAIKEIIEFEVGGLSELLRSDGSNYTPYAWLSRSIAGVVDGQLIISLPGSKNAIKEGLQALIPILPHTIKMIQGGNHD
ncbi:bifunctional molybdenum cofactor biosynthesis protein MoaC/MoaB [Francisellaceae bacterium]|nr:bifunctional molybdenum cofactor biosynthesis protein MoaC/MoaB [Francisellaceae bacterium]